MATCFSRHRQIISGLPHPNVQGDIFDLERLFAAKELPLRDVNPVGTKADHIPLLMSDLRLLHPRLKLNSEPLHCIHNAAKATMTSAICPPIRPSEPLLNPTPV